MATTSPPSGLSASDFRYLVQDMDESVLTSLRPEELASFDLPANASPDAIRAKVIGILDVNAELTDIQSDTIARLFEPNAENHLYHARIIEDAERGRHQALAQHLNATEAATAGEAEEVVTEALEAEAVEAQGAEKDTAQLVEFFEGQQDEDEQGEIDALMRELKKGPTSDR